MVDRMGNIIGCSVAFLVVFLIVMPRLYSVASGSQNTTISRESGGLMAPPSTKYAATTLSDTEIIPGLQVIRSDHIMQMVESTIGHPRGRKFFDYTKDPTHNGLQTIVNVWEEGSYSPVHKHTEYSETFVCLDGALAFFTFTDDGKPTCHILSSANGNQYISLSELTARKQRHQIRGGYALKDTFTGGAGGSTAETTASPFFNRQGGQGQPQPNPEARAIVVGAGHWHGMTVAPKSMGYPGYAAIFETSDHRYDPAKRTKLLAPFSKVVADGLEGDPEHFRTLLHEHCPWRGEI